MKLNQFTIQPYRIWYQYLQTALNNVDYSHKINKKYYKDWSLNLVKKLTFNQWYQTHKELFAYEDKTGFIIIYPNIPWESDRSILGTDYFVESDIYPENKKK